MTQRLCLVRHTGGLFSFVSVFKEGGLSQVLLDSLSSPPWLFMTAPPMRTLSSWAHRPKAAEITQDHSSVCPFCSRSDIASLVYKPDSLRFLFWFFGFGLLSFSGTRTGCLLCAVPAGSSSKGSSPGVLSARVMDRTVDVNVGP